MAGKKKEALKDYVEVVDRLKEFRASEDHKGWRIVPEIIDFVRPKGITEKSEMNSSENGFALMKVNIFDDDNNLRAVGHAYEVQSEGFVNKTSYIENCETSALGRALAFLGFGVDKSISSKEEIDRAKQREQMFEVFTNIKIPLVEAQKQVKLSIKELLQKLGARVEDLEMIYKEKTLGGNLKEASLKQLQNVERNLRTANNEDSKWHELYGKNSRIKNPTPKGQEILYKASATRFGELALQRAKGNEDLQFEILEYYQNAGYDLSEYLKTLKG